MSELRPSRRTLLEFVAGLAVVPSPRVAQITDPLHRLVIAYRTEVACFQAIRGDIPDDVPTPALDALTAVGGLPAATSKDGAQAALQLAIEMLRAGILTTAQPNLIQAALY